MKKLLKLIVVTFVTVCLSASLFGQGVTASANATATIITPIAITKNTDMAFGNIAVGAAGGTVVLATDGSRTSTGDVSFQSTPVGAAAAFVVTGSAGLTYDITLPASATITSGGNNMTVNTFTSNPSGTGTLTGGTENLLVGATLVVGAAQATGAYTGSFDVTVGYN